MMTDITAAYLRTILHYDPKTGIFRWRVRMSPARGAGEIAGAKSGNYIRIGIKRRWYQAHRLAWLYVHGKWPLYWLDHANGDKLDNRLENLREATHSQNQMNSRRAKHNTSGFKGVTF